MLTLMMLLACSGADKDTTGKDTDGTGEDTDRPGQDTDEPDPEPDAIDDNTNSTAGDFAYDYLTDGDYVTLVVEIDWVSGNEPEASAVAELQSVLEELCRKPGGVEIVLDDEVPPQGSPVWTYEAAEELELSWRDRYHDADGGTAVMYFLFLDGSSEKDTDSGRVLGYAYRGSSLIMFKETMESTGGGLTLSAPIEDTVIVHEAGHVLGLVDNGIPMVSDHRDEDHGNHDDNDECIMYWSVSTDAIVDVLGLGGGSVDFDDECRADMIAAGGKE
ncbi:MAG: hypothetical protein ACI8S6_001078 [Myxococcota bacterium]|jgi:hypothetical protein